MTQTTTGTTHYFDECLTHNRQIFIDGRYETACDYLLAALHLAVDTADAWNIQRVEKQAAYQSQWLEAHPSSMGWFFATPHYRRQLISRYHMVIRQAKAHRLILEAEQLQERFVRHR